MNCKVMSLTRICGHLGFSLVGKLTCPRIGNKTKMCFLGFEGERFKEK